MLVLSVWHNHASNGYAQHMLGSLAIARSKAFAGSVNVAPAPSYATCLRLRKRSANLDCDNPEARRISLIFIASTSKVREGCRVPSIISFIWAML